MPPHPIFGLYKRMSTHQEEQEAIAEEYERQMHYWLQNGRREPIFTDVWPPPGISPCTVEDDRGRSMTFYEDPQSGRPYMPTPPRKRNRYDIALGRT